MVVKEEQNKYKQFVFTLNSDKEGELISSSLLESSLQKLYSNYFFQLEKGEETGKLHYQGYFVSDIRKRKQTVLNDIKELGVDIKQLTVNPMQGTLEQNTLYCSKSNTSQGKPFTNQLIYSGKDIELLDEKENRYGWQQKLFDYIFEEDVHLLKDPTSSREIIWCFDSCGNSGKSLFTKWICYRNSSTTKVAFGSAQQLRSAIVTIGPKKLFILDIPRTLGDDDSLKNIYSVVREDKNMWAIKY